MHSFFPFVIQFKHEGLTPSLIKFLKVSAKPGMFLLEDEEKGCA